LRLSDGETYGETDVSQPDTFGEILEGLVTREDGDIRYSLSGEVDASNADQVLNRLVELIGSRPGCVELDLAGVTFIDSAGVRTLAFAREVAADRGGLVVTSVSPRVERMIRLMGLEEELLPRRRPST
jgi:anti-anti-sigma factor